MKKIFAAFLPLLSFAQGPSCYWQQEVHYEMDIRMDTKKHGFEGFQKLTYYNNSPDTLHRVFYHLYFNAFQPESMMDERSRDLPDPDKRVKDRIYKLKEKETGYHHIQSLTQNGEKTFYTVHQTLLQVELSKALPPGDSAVFEMNFVSQVPVQIRRSGRDNEEGVDYTMTQWYPKMAEYDKNGWHADPYVAREFYGVFGTFDVNITIDADYVIGGTGVLKDPENYWTLKEQREEVSFHELSDTENDMRTWSFHAEDVHDFAWAADEDFIRTSCEGPEDMELNFYYLPGKWEENWEALPAYTHRFFSMMNEQFGKYLYPQFSVIQGGDGGMEYPMCTMLKGTGKLEGLVGVMVHESAHNWYYGMLASNENQYPWMDEGFTSFAEEEILNELLDKNKENPHEGAYRAHTFLVSKEGAIEPLATPADYFDMNLSYGISAYSRGEVFLAQLRYIIGEPAFSKGMLKYYDKWKLKHPDPWDFIKVMEDVSGVQLDWYLNFWMNTTKHIDYGIEDVEAHGRGTAIVVLKKEGNMPMPLLLTLELTDGTKIKYQIPLVSMFGYSSDKDLQHAEAWPWTHRTYELDTKLPIGEIRRVVIDEGGFMADIDRSNNIYELDQE